MKRNLISVLVLMLLVLQQGYSQQMLVEQEDFDGSSIKYTPTRGSWVFNTNYYLPSLKQGAIASRSYQGLVPNKVGDSAFFNLSIPLDFYPNRYSQVLLRFSHICKISPNDIAQIQYRFTGQSTWETIEKAAYMGNAANFSMREGFNAASYPEWLANDSTAIPSQSWWQEEFFDLSVDVGLQNGVEIRFVLVHGSVRNTQAAYGWLLENIQIIASTHQLYPPTVAFVAPLIKDTVYSTGPWAINAKVKTNTTARIEVPWLTYTASKNGQHIITDSVLMSNVRGDSLWVGYIPQFQAGTDVFYSITGRDTTGNSAMAMSGYHIKQLMGGGAHGYVYIGDTLSTSTQSYVPYYVGYDYSWTRTLVLASEVDLGMQGGMITSLAYLPTSYSRTAIMQDQKLYVKAVPNNVLTSNAWIDPSLDGATLVWQGNIPQQPVNVWMDLPFETPFLLPPGMNLMIYWVDNDGSYSGSVSWKTSAAVGNMSVYKYADGSFPTTAGNYRTDRPVMRMNMLAGTSDSNSVALHSIDMADTIAVRSGIQTPLVVTLKNKGGKMLESTTVYYSINNSAPIPYSWNSTPGLPWDFNAQVTIGNYQATINGNDTITVWVESPNGVYDSTTWDDTLTKVIFGTSDYKMYFVDYFTDTIMTTGGFSISAYISTYSSRPVGNVTLEVESTKGGITTPLSIPMQYNASKGLYEGEIPQIQFSSHIVYSITKTDYLGNIVSIVDSFYIKRVSGSGSDGGYVYVGDTLSTSTQAYVPYYTTYDYGWSRTMAHASELNANSIGGIINSIGFMPTTYSRTANMTNQSLYFKAVSDASIITDAWVDPIADGATLVWQGTITPPPVNVWMDIVLDNSFRLPPNSNLLVYWVNDDGNWTGSVAWKSETTTTNMSVYKYADGTFPTTVGTYRTDRPVMRFEMSGRLTLDEVNSVALETIESPLYGGVTAGQSIPVIVSLRNKGITDLDSCTINWSRNGHLQTPTYIYKGRYNGKLWDDFADTITIGSYTPVAAQVDDIIVWVSLPNNVVDNVTSDDTLNVKTIACSGPLSGSYQVGASGFFPNISSALFMMEQCGLSGKLTLQLQDGTYAENIDLSILDNVATATDTIEIVSLSGNASNVTLTPIKFGIRTGKVSNVLVKNITINLIGEGYGIQLGAGNNIEINGCNINLDDTLAKTLSTGTTHVGIYKASSVPSNDVKIVNNFISGGYNGVLLYAGASSTNLGNNWLYENNRHENAYWHSANLIYGNFTSISNNISLPLSDSAYSYTGWWGLTVQYGSVGVLANNKVNASRHPKLTEPRGMYLSSLNQGPSAVPTLIKNNEMILKAGANTYYGMYVYNSLANIYHNSIYVNSSSQMDNYGLHVESNKQVNVKNNNVVSTLGYAINYTSISTITSDYNNFYTGGAVLGSFGTGTYANLSSWKNASRQDVNSVSVSSQFADISTSMELSSGFESYLCPQLSDVPTDIDNNARHTLTSMGAYTIDPFNYNFAHIEFYQWEEEVIVNQTIPVEINVTNLSSIPLPSVSLDWSVNGTPQPTYSYTFPSAIPAFGSSVINIGSFPVSQVNEVEVWLKSVNGSTNHPMKDSIYARSVIKPLAEFVAPLVDDTVTNLTFDVNAIIRTVSGAPVTAPILDITTIVNGLYTVTSSVPMTLTDGVWTAAVPQQYYGSNVIYSLTVTDALHNTLTITDSTHIKFMGFGVTDSALIIGTGTSTSSNNPFYYNYDYSWSRNYYRAHEIDPAKQGGFIHSISFYNTSTSTNSPVDNISLYLKAVTDSIAVSGYLDPIADGATLVWGASTSPATGSPGWVTFMLNTPFQLPPNMNLLIYCDNYDGSYGGNMTTMWQTTTQNINTSIYAYADGSFPSGATGTVTTSRPNIKLNIMGSDPYAGYNLAVLSMVEPVNTEDLCTPDYSPVEIAITNLGEHNYDFTQNPINVGIEIDDPIGNHYYYTNTIFTGILKSGETEVIQFMSAMAIMYSGVYDIKAWVNSSVDVVPYDDTLKTQFISGRIGLPIQEDFSNGLPIQFVSSSVAGKSKWEKYFDPASDVQPSLGTAMLRFVGTPGSVSVLSTRQLDLYQATNPFMEFWYYHDTNAANDDFSYTDINIIEGGVSINIATIYVRDPQGRHGWVNYRYDLSSFTSSNACVLIQFEAMNKLSSSTQYIDYVQISSDQDAAVSKIIITPEPTLCNTSGYDISVVLTATTAQSITFDNTASLKFDINGTIHTIPLQGRILASNSSDTIRVLSGAALAFGTTSMKAYFGTTVDKMPANDTAKYDIVITPKFTIDILTISDNTPNDRTTVGYPHKQVVTVTNTGNMDLADIGLVLSIDENEADPVYHFRLQRTIGRNLSPGETMDFEFDLPYIVPKISQYTVKVHGYLVCDSANINVTNSTLEYVDMDDLALKEIVTPEDNSNTIDVVGSKIEVSIKVENLNSATEYDPGKVKVRYKLIDLEGKQEYFLSASEDIDEKIIAGVPVTHTFNAKYTVPELTKYYLVVFIEKNDKYQQNDTLRILRETDYVGVSNIEGVSFTLKQNIPNPAKDKTVINYNIPQDGEVQFQVYSVSGQLLYSQKENARFGDNRIELNISDYASGIYFYTMEYKGQRISKRMSITR